MSSVFGLLYQLMTDHMGTTNIYFSSFWKLGSPRSNTSLLSGENIIPVSWIDSHLLMPHIVEVLKEFSGVSFIRALILFTRAPSLDKINFQRPHLQILSHWGYNFNMWIWRRIQTFSPWQWATKGIYLELLQLYINVVIGIRT